MRVQYAGQGLCGLWRTLRMKERTSQTAWRFPPVAHGSDACPGLMKQLCVLRSFTLKPDEDGCLPSMIPQCQLVISSIREMLLRLFVINTVWQRWNDSLVQMLMVLAISIKCFFMERQISFLFFVRVYYLF